MPANTPRGISYPLYTDPISGTQAYFQDMATDMDGLVQQLDDRLDAARHRPAVKISAFSNQLLTPFVANTVTFDFEDFDRGGMADIAVSNTRIQLLERGIYIVGASLSCTPATGTWGVQAQLIGTGGGFGGGLVTQRGSSTTLDTSTTPTYLNPTALWFTDGTAPVNITVAITMNSPGTVNVQDRNLFAAKVSNTAGGF